MAFSGIMITEDYVSFEVSKLLKEKGFVTDNITILVSNDNNHFVSGKSGYDFLLQNGYEVYPAPTLQMAIKWLNEVHHILVVSDYEYECTDTSWYFKIYRLGENGKPERVPVKGVTYDDSGEHEHIVRYRDYERSYKDYATREEADDEGIRYVLENLM